MSLLGNLFKPAQGIVTAGSRVAERASLWGDKFVYPLTSKQYALADEGSYWLARNPTPGTGIAGHAAATTFDDAKPLLVINNTHASLKMYLDYIRLYLTSAGTAGTNVRFDMKLDDILKASAGGSAITPVNVNMDAVDANAGAFGGTIRFGAVTGIAASADVRLLYPALHRSVIGVVGDSYTLNFGGVGHGVKSLATAGTAIAHTQTDHGPVVIGPGDSFALYQWSASQSGAYAFEFEVGLWQR